MPALPPLKFSYYGVVEKALAVAYGVPEERRPVAFRALLSNLQKLGALGPQSRVGRGKKLDYTPVELHRVMLTLEFCELGVAPSTAVSLLDAYWESKLKPIVDAAARPIGIVPEQPDGDDVILYLVGVSFRTASLRGEAPSVPNIGRCSLDALPIELRRWMTATPNDPAPPRALAMNLSARLRVFHNALADANLDDALAERRATLVGEQPPPNAPAPAPRRRARTRPKRPPAAPDETGELP